MSTTVINAYVMPIVERYLQRIVSSLHGAGVHTGLNIMQSNGGVMTAETAGQKKRAHGAVRAGGGRARRYRARAQRGIRQHHHHRHGRHVVRRFARARQQAVVHDGERDRRSPDQDPDDRHQDARRRRRLDRADRRGRRAAGRPRERRRRPGSGVLRAWRRGAYRDGRQRRARLPRSEQLRGRRHRARRAARPRGDPPQNRSADGSFRRGRGRRHPARGQCHDDPRHPARVGRARPRSARFRGRLLRRRRARARGAARAGARHPDPDRARRPRRDLRAGSADGRFQARLLTHVPRACRGARIGAAERCLCRSRGARHRTDAARGGRARCDRVPPLRRHAL